MMPPPNQEPWEGQKYSISTQRQHSEIPKGGTEDTWLFPSPQMFYNSLQRKQKAQDVSESDMDILVHLHNSLNNNTWSTLFRDWEAKYHPYGESFDRHFWFIDRCGKEVQYIIDFYQDDSKADKEKNLSSISIHARPALNSLENIMDWIKYKLSFEKELKSFEYKKFQPVSTLTDLPKKKETLSSDDNQQIAQARDVVRQAHISCSNQLQDLLNCASDEKQGDCTKQRMAMSTCFGKVIPDCRSITEKFFNVLESSNPDLNQINTTFHEVDRCTESYMQKFKI